MSDLENLADILDKNRNRQIPDSHWEYVKNKIFQLGKKYTKEEKKSVPTLEIIYSEFDI